MKVRNRLVNEYKGELTDAADKYCPCRPCYNAHDCGYTNSQGKWIKDFQCAIRYNNGCPTPLTNKLPIPIHIIRSKVKYRKRGQTRKCLRCGKRVTIGEINFILYEAHNINGKRKEKQ